MEAQDRSEPIYQVYLVRLRWVAADDGRLACRVMARGVDSQEWRSFADLAGFVVFLEQRAARLTAASVSATGRCEAQ